jgi:hypothetical protein
VITELEIGAVGTDYLRWRSRWAREDLGKARTWVPMKYGHFFEMHTHTTMIRHVSTSNISGRNWVRPEREDDARRHHNGPGANRTIDTLTMINCIFCTRSWIYVWYYGGGILVPVRELVLVPLVLVLALVLVLRPWPWLGQVLAQAASSPTDTASASVKSTQSG